MEPYPPPSSPLSGPIAVPQPRRSPEAAPESGEPSHLHPNPVRWKVIDRLALAGLRHAGHLLDRARTAAVPARHAVLFLFHETTCGADDGVRIASRMFLHGEDVEDLTAVLHALADRASDYRRASLSPLPRIIDRHEPMTRQARYLATATSSLAPTDDPAEPRAWHGIARLVDSTQLLARKRLLDPAGMIPDPGDLVISTTHTLAVPMPLKPFGMQRMWRFLPSDPGSDPELAADPGPGAMSALDRLHALITDSERRSRHHRRTP